VQGSTFHRSASRGVAAGGRATRGERNGLEPPRLPDVLTQHSSASIVRHPIASIAGRENHEQTRP
jgi:hypothetical protein